jgi:condensin complex subunit 3
LVSNNSFFSDVRRAVLINIPIGQDTLPAILDRTSDTDTNMRKAVFDSVLEKNVLQGSDEKIIGPTHPRALSIQQRELIVKNGLGDREPAVRAVAANLLASWIDVADMDSGVVRSSSKGGDKEQFESKVLAFLNLFDLNEGEVATNALSSIFQAKADIIENIEFDGRRLAVIRFPSFYYWP